GRPPEAGRAAAADEETGDEGTGETACDGCGHRAEFGKRKPRARGRRFGGRRPSRGGCGRARTAALAPGAVTVAREAVRVARGVAGVVPRAARVVSGTQGRVAVRPAALWLVGKQPGRAVGEHVQRIAVLRTGKQSPVRS